MFFNRFENNTICMWRLKDLNYKMNIKIFFMKSYITNIKNQYDANPEKIVARILLLKIPTPIAIIAAKIFGLSSKCINPLLQSIKKDPLALACTGSNPYLAPKLGQ